MIREVLRMGDPRLLRVARPVTAFDTAALHELVTDLFDTMVERDGAGLAAPVVGGAGGTAEPGNGICCRADR